MSESTAEVLLTALEIDVLLELLDRGVPEPQVSPSSASTAPHSFRRAGLMNISHKLREAKEELEGS